MKRFLAILLTLLLVPPAVGAALLLTILAGETTLGGFIVFALLTLCALSTLVKAYTWICRRFGLRTMFGPNG
jgi:hypothetical protein